MGRILRYLDNASPVPKRNQHVLLFLFLSGHPELPTAQTGDDCGSQLSHTYTRRSQTNTLRIDIQDQVARSTMASVRKVTFHLLESMASPKIKGSVTVTLGSKSTKTSILQAVAYLLGKSSLGFVDKQGRRVNFDSTLSQSDCYVTEYACTKVLIAVWAFLCFN